MNPKTCTNKKYCLTLKNKVNSFDNMKTITSEKEYNPD